MPTKDTTNLTISVKGYSVSPEGETYIHDDTQENVCACLVVCLVDQGQDDEHMALSSQIVGIWDEYRLYRLLNTLREQVGEAKYSAADMRLSMMRLMEVMKKDKD